MEVYRYRRQGRLTSTRVSKSVTTLPALGILSLGLLIVIVAIILFAAYGIPNKQLSKNLKSLSGPLLLVVGLILFIGGIAYGVYLNRKERRRKKEEKLQQQAMKEQAQKITVQRHPVMPPQQTMQQALPPACNPDPS